MVSVNRINTVIYREVFTSSTPYLKINPVAEIAIGIFLGMNLWRVTLPLTEKIVGIQLIKPSADSHLIFKIAMVIFAIAAPFAEEPYFRGDVQEGFGEARYNHYKRHGYSHKFAKIVATITSIFVTSIVFGLCHFANVLSFAQNPINFVPQVINSTFTGVAFGIAKELTADLRLPTYLHLGNNIAGVYFLLTYG